MPEPTGSSPSSPSPSAFVAAARQLLGDRLLTRPEDTAPYLTDWRKRYVGAAQAVALPASTDQVADLVRLCAAHRVPIVPQGGNTGLVGGGTPDASGVAVVVSLRRMKRVRAVDPVNDTITVEAGCTLVEVQQAAAEAQRLFPLSLAAEGSCTIGGNLSTNAGGVQVLRYGNSRELCLGLEVVTAAGEIWDGLSGLRKDNTGYDLKDLFIGAEGTLGVITAAVLKMFPLPAARVTALATVQSPAAAVRLLTLAQQALGPALTAFEMMSDLCIDLVVKHYGLRRPFARRSPYYVLIESSDSEGEAHAQARFEALMQQVLEQTIAGDAIIASSLAQSRALWQLRESVSEAQALEGKNIKHDVSVPISRIADFVARTDALLAERFPGVRMVNFGHLGDGNLHYNVSPPVGALEADFLALQPGINQVVHDSVQAHGGSISAEHGVGQLKREEITHYKSPVALALMRSLKRALDPMGLMNPGKVI